MLGNTPAVARRSYIDPRVFDRYDSGWTIAGALDRLEELDPAADRDRARLERAVLDLLADDESSPALERAGRRMISSALARCGKTDGSAVLDH